MTLKEGLTVAAILLAWFALNRWVLPWLGIPTCMSGACSIERTAAARPGTSASQSEPQAGGQAPSPTNPDAKPGELPQTKPTPVGSKSSLPPCCRVGY